MKKYIVFILLMFFSRLSFAQIGKMTTSERILSMNILQRIKINSDQATVYSEIIRYDHSSTIVLSNYSLNNIVAPGHHKTIAGPALRGEIAVDTEENEFIENIKVKDKELFFYKPKSVKSPYALIYQMIDKDEVIQNGSIEIPNLEKFKLYDNYGTVEVMNPLRVKFMASKDQESIFIIYSQDQWKKTSESDKIEQTILTLDPKTMSLKSQCNYSLNFDLLSTKLVPNYNNYLYSLMILETPDTVKKMFNYDWLRFYKIIGLNTSINGGRQDFEIELENKKITDVNFDFAQNGDLIVAGLFSRPVGNKYPNRNIHGCFTKRIEINTKRIIWENETLFNKSIIAATMGVQSANLDLGTTNNFCLMDIAFLKNGSVCLIMEDRDIKENFPLYSDYSSGFSTGENFAFPQSIGSNQPSYYYNSLIVANIDQYGKTVWTKQIPKHQENNIKHRHDKAVGYSYHVSENKIQFVFADSKKNYDSTTLLHTGAEANGPSYIKLSRFQRNSLALCEIDEQGESKQRIIASGYGYSFFSRLVNWTENNDEIIVVTVKGWSKYSISKVKL
jgi:hypothetical protein